MGKAGEKKEDGEYDAEFHKERIFGGHVGEYMESLKEEDETQYQKLYAKYIENDVEADGLEDMYKEAHRRSARARSSRRRSRRSGAGAHRQQGHQRGQDVDAEGAPEPQ